MGNGEEFAPSLQKSEKDISQKRCDKVVNCKNSKYTHKDRLKYFYIKKYYYNNYSKIYICYGCLI